MSVHAAYQGLIEKAFFRGRSTRVSEGVAYIAANLFLVLVLFYIVLNTVVYNWTGALYSQGFHLNTALDNLIPFAPAWAIFYLYLFYPLSALTMAYFVFIDYRRGYPLAFSLVLINLVADVVYMVFPGDHRHLPPGAPCPPDGRETRSPPPCTPTMHRTRRSTASPASTPRWRSSASTPGIVMPG